ncbi:riboflavin biosynthesis protein RibF [Porphyromonas circumdentaria]|uniref:riboflavin biosynthesis protein RibF n=1 Tax=Porphyromonas circumdentaria TaxID=29524 RepID=UPI0026DC0CD8|nr:riboflavin biosynthesis protein RibF [Porphyromonas circumdentaria]MDO4722674.1 riboflavin biosynthesis protein RibF [Porphyromonas circumdentaria]
MDTIRLIRSEEGISLPKGVVLSTPLVATMGVFDGVHLGHKYLIECLKEEARREGLSSAVITFDQPPIAVIRPDIPYEKLHSEDEKLIHLAETGVDYVIVLPFDRPLAALSAEEFCAQILSKELSVRRLLMGYDHNFGRPPQKGAPPTDYQAIGKRYGIEILPQGPIFDEDMNLPYSSSTVRKLLREGNLTTANRFLGYPYCLRGAVIGGLGLGRKLGYPTANIELEDDHKLIPPHGVYAVWVSIEGVRYGGMLYIGRRPSIAEGLEESIEVNIFDFSGNLYEQKISIELMAHTRGEMYFDKHEDLVAQIDRDFEEVQKILTENPR